jgi:hypothetical protein
MDIIKNKIQRLNEAYKKHGMNLEIIYEREIVSEPQLSYQQVLPDKEWSDWKMYAKISIKRQIITIKPFTLRTTIDETPMILVSKLCSFLEFMLDEILITGNINPSDIQCIDSL